MAPKEGFRGGADKITDILRTSDPLPKAVDQVRQLAG